MVFAANERADQKETEKTEQRDVPTEPRMAGTTSSAARRAVPHFPLALLLLPLVFLAPPAAAALASESPPRADDPTTATCPGSATTTLREFLYPGSNKDNNSDDDEDDDADVYLAMGPAFFGFYGYFGALEGMEDALFGSGGGGGPPASSSLLVDRGVLSGVAGASAGAMAAVLLAAGIAPGKAASFVSDLGLSDFADPGGLGGVLRGDRFESIMEAFLAEASPIAGAGGRRDRRRFPWLELEDSLVPVAVSAVDVLPRVRNGPSNATAAARGPLRWVAEAFLPTPKILTRGSMARAARASACFPGLFQPVGWVEHRGGDGDGSVDYSLLIDGGIFDWAGYNGLREIVHSSNNTNTTNNSSNNNNKSTNTKRKKIRVLNMVVGGFGTSPPGPASVAKGLGVTTHDDKETTGGSVVLDSVLSLSIRGLPGCGPLSMSNGPLAVRAARAAVAGAMDRPLVATAAASSFSSAPACGGDEREKRSRHFVLEVDASAAEAASGE